jgi:hypothetical protein
VQSVVSAKSSVAAPRPIARLRFFVAKATPTAPRPIATESSEQQSAPYIGAPPS